MVVFTNFKTTITTSIRKWHKLDVKHILQNSNPRESADMADRQNEYPPPHRLCTYQLAQAKKPVANIQ